MLTLTDVELLLRRAEACRVVVVGDVMLDEYLWGEIARISPEAPVPVLHLCRLDRSPGGAANVARNVAALGARVSVVGVVGADSASASLSEELDRNGIGREALLVDASRPTTRKCRLMSLEHSQQVFRFDEENAEEISAAVEDQLLSTLYGRLASAQAVVCSDYLKGVLTPRVLRETAALARRCGIPLITAPKDANPEKYSGASVLMPNLREFAALAGKPFRGGVPGWLEEAARMLLAAHDFSSLLITRGREGMTLFTREDGSIDTVEIPAAAQSVFDVTGAGDTALGVFALAVAAGASYRGAALLANLAAGIVVGKRGTATVTPQELLEQVSRVLSEVPPVAQMAAV